MNKINLQVNKTRLDEPSATPNPRAQLLRQEREMLSEVYKEEKNAQITQFLG